MKEFEFPYPNEEQGYSLFPDEYEESTEYLFHGTLIDNFDSIKLHGFKPASEICKEKDLEFVLTSVSYAKKSSYSLGHICYLRKANPGEYVVFLVKFETLEHPNIKDNDSDIHVFNSEIQPSIIGFCKVPTDYIHI